MRNRRPEPYMFGAETNRMFGTDPGAITTYWLKLTGDIKHMAKLGSPLLKKGWRVPYDNDDLLRQARTGVLLMFTTNRAVALNYMPIEQWIESLKPNRIIFASLGDIIAFHKRKVHEWAEVEVIFEGDGSVDCGRTGMGQVDLQLLYWNICDHFGDRAEVTITNNGEVRARKKAHHD